MMLHRNGHNNFVILERLLIEASALLMAKAYSCMLGGFVVVHGEGPGSHKPETQDSDARQGSVWY